MFSLTRQFSVFGIGLAVTSILVWKFAVPSMISGGMAGVCLGLAIQMIFVGVIPAFRMERDHKRWLDSWGGRKL